MDIALGKHILDLRGRIASNFNAENWEEIGLLTGHSKAISLHPRLLRSLSWGDEDYGGNVLWFVKFLAESDPGALKAVESYLEEKFPSESVFISAKPSEKKITFAPNVFQIPDYTIENDLLAVMMPFGKEFDGVYASIKLAAGVVAYRCLRADDIWEDSTIMQDVFNLIFRAQVVLVDFTNKNPNVMYETGIAHTLGKLVIPIAQSINDVPFDMAHHRVLTYLPNSEGLSKLQSALTSKLSQVLA